jgi:predicted RNase H-like HicB family nuclease
MEFTIILEPDDRSGAFTVLLPALPGCITQGRWREEAIAWAREAIAAYVESLRADGEDAPEDSAPIEVLKVPVEG